MKSSSLVTASSSPSEPPSGLRRRDDVPEELQAFVNEVLKPSSRWRKLGLPPADADDILQRALVRLLEHRDVIEKGSYPGWFRSVLRHEILTSLRRALCRELLAPSLEAHAHFDAIQRGPSSPFPSPDSQSLLLDVLVAADWLVQQVSPGRRAVAEQCLQRILADGELWGIADIAAGLGLSPGTVGSQWARAKEEMSAALARERHKSGKSPLAALFGFLAGLWLWLATGERRDAGPQAVRGQRDAGRQAVRGQRDAGPQAIRGQRARMVSLFACALLPLALVTHTALETGLLLGETSGALAGLARQLGGIESMHDATRDTEWTTFAPHLSTNAEREPEWATGQARRGPPASHPVPEAHLAAGRLELARPRVPASHPTPGVHIAAGRLELARSFLARATEAIALGELGVARDALQHYDYLLPENTLARERARLLAGLGSR